MEERRAKANRRATVRDSSFPFHPSIHRQGSQASQLEAVAGLVGAGPVGAAPVGVEAEPAAGAQSAELSR